MLDFTLAERIQCSKKDKEKLLYLIQNIMAMSCLARKKGLLELEKFVQGDIPQMPYMLRRGISLVIDGIEPDYIIKTMEHFIMSGNYKGYELLSRIIIRDGVEMVQMGQNPGLLAETLTAWLGEDYQTEIDLEELRKASETCTIFGIEEAKRKRQELIPSPISQIKKRTEQLLENDKLLKVLQNTKDSIVALFIKTVFDEEEKKQELLEGLSEDKRSSVLAVETGGATLKEVAEALANIEAQVKPEMQFTGELTDL